MKFSLSSHLNNNLVEFRTLIWKPFTPQNFEVSSSLLVASSSIVEKFVAILIPNMVQPSFFKISYFFNYSLMFNISITFNIILC